ncbi:MAG: hypothetical protein GWO08_14940 [Gammaproteobacteria bacterium]|nr:hypothetical protein [Gammaproteobacteria bacterium]
MTPMKLGDWKPADINSLLADVVDAVENGDIDTAFDRVELTSGNLTRTKNTRNYTKNYLAACIRAGVNGVSEASESTALGLVNAFRRMSSEPPLEQLPDGYKVVAIKLSHGEGNPDVEIYIKEGSKVIYGEKVLPRGVLTENFLSVTGSSLF